MYRKMNKVHRHTGRMTRDPSMRMSNRGEVGFGMVGTLSLFILAIIILGVFL
jgi:hypothetical protein